MNLITVYDYEQRNTSMKNLFLCWLTHVNKFAKGFNVYIIYGDKIQENDLNYLVENRLPNVNWKTIKGNVSPYKYDISELDNNYHVNFNLYNVMKVGKQINEPFIYIDLDAILLSDLSEWWGYINDRVFIGTSHYPIGTTLNAGVYSVSNTNEINYDILINKFFENRNKYEEIIRMSSVQNKTRNSLLSYVNHQTIFNKDGTLRHSGDQALYANYFIFSNESPYYEKHDMSWNVFASRVDYDMSSNGIIDIKKVNARYTNKVKILHAYSFAKKTLLTKINESGYYNEIYK